MVSEEQQYLDLMRNIMEKGASKPNRTGIDTLSIFTPPAMHFTLYDSTTKRRIMPLLTTKKINFQSVAKELLWFLQGDTNAKNLDKQGVKIWNANTTREFLDKRGLSHYVEGDIGPGYGWQWRCFGGAYLGCNASRASQDGHGAGGVDQIRDLIDNLRKDPYSRRHIVTAWNPQQLNAIALPPCHILYQINVDPDPETGQPRYLDASMYQRSADVPLGVPFNIASYALLTHMISYIVGLEPRNLTITTGDTHIYKNQLPGCEEQLKRIPTAFPTLEFTIPPENIKIQDPADFKIEHLTIKDYNPQPFINFPFAT
jgi:thymidylate synthase